MSDWIAIAKLTEIPQRGARLLKTDTADIAIFRTGSDEVFAVSDQCPHLGGPLSQGIVHGNAVTCPLHNWKIDLNSGDVMAPDEGCVRTYPVKIEAGVVYLGATEVQATIGK
ncbi:MAG: nitrite reductase small subunit NirD [Candidatus Polarisedimenticolaceae bacterium]|nr:nitrite reductase small subunit NirD [Candidatus Polarisedimenticolaceae bacterium]